MWILIGLIAVAFIILYQRSTGIIKVNPLRGPRQGPLPGEAAPSGGDPLATSFAGVLGAIKRAAEEAARQAEAAQAAGQASAQGHPAILQLVRSNQFLEAIQLYRRLHGVDLQTAKRAVDKMMLER